MLIIAILSSNLESIVTSLDLSFALNSFNIFNLLDEISAIGLSFITLNASLLEVCIFLVFVAGIATHISSSEFLWPIIATSAISEVAYLAAQIKFRLASLEALSMDLCE